MWLGYEPRTNSLRVLYKNVLKQKKTNTSQENRSIIGAHRSCDNRIRFRFLVGDCFVHRWTVRWEIVECLVVADNTTFTMNRFDGCIHVTIMTRSSLYFADNILTDIFNLFNLCIQMDIHISIMVLLGLLYTLDTACE